MYKQLVTITFLLKLNKLISCFFIKILLFFIRIYQLILSPYLGNNCRFHPTCSNYSIIALKRWGVLKGTFLTIKRLLKCNPLFKSGVDLVPEKKNKIN